MESFKALRDNINWLYSILASKNYTTEFKQYAYKTIQKLEEH